jgi:hypothetical protein
VLITLVGRMLRCRTLDILNGAGEIDLFAPELGQ